jgi:hypothetical protein
MVDARLDARRFPLFAIAARELIALLVVLQLAWWAALVWMMLAVFA